MGKEAALGKFRFYMRKRSFTEKVVCPWNKAPTAPSLSEFKEYLNDAFDAVVYFR